MERELRVTDGIWGRIAAGRAAPSAADAERPARERLAALPPAALDTAARVLQVEAARAGPGCARGGAVYRWPRDAARPGRTAPGAGGRGRRETGVTRATRAGAGPGNVSAHER